MKEYAKLKDKLKGYDISEADITLKKQYVDVCRMGQAKAGKGAGDVVISFADLAKLVNIKVDDVEEWVIEAMGNHIIEAKIDQIESNVHLRA